MSGEVWERFKQIAVAQGHKTAIIDAANGQAMNYAAMLSRAETLAAEIGERPERTIAWVGEPELAALPVILACAAAGRCFVPLSDRETPDRLAQTLKNLPGPLLFANADGLSDFPVTAPGPELSELARGWQWSEGVPGDEGPVPFLVTHSSGSTGQPKAIAFSQATKLYRTKQSILLFTVSDADTILSATPVHHSLGQRHFFLSLMTGATLVKAHPFSRDLWLKAVQKYDVTFAIPVATHLKILQANILQDPAILASFRCMVTSSAPAEPDFKREILDQATFDFWEVYGMTETACATAVRYVQGDDTAHLGRAVDGSTIRIGVGGTYGAGEIEVYSDCLCDGYWGDPERWADAKTVDGYFRSGDLGRLDAHGNLVFLGRTNESFDSGGVTIFPAEIERVVSELSQILDCMAFGLPDKVFGNLVAVAYVADGQVADRDIIRHARAKLPRHMWPARIFKQSVFPTTSSGKVDRLSLAASILTEFGAD